MNKEKIMSFQKAFNDLLNAAIVVNEEWEKLSNNEEKLINDNLDDENYCFDSLSFDEWVRKLKEYVDNTNENISKSLENY